MARNASPDGKIVSDYRQANNLTASDLAARLGVSRQYVHQIETGVFRFGIVKLSELWASNDSGARQIVGMVLAAYFPGYPAQSSTSAPATGTPANGRQGKGLRFDKDSVTDA